MSDIIRTKLDFELAFSVGLSLTVVSRPLWQQLTIQDCFTVSNLPQAFCGYAVLVKAGFTNSIILVLIAS